MNLKLETERLILRPLELSDVDDMFAMDSNPNVHIYLGNNPLKTKEESLGYLKNIQNQYKENGIGRFAMIKKESNEFIGWCGLKFITEEENNHSHFYEIGYRLKEEFWGKGYAYEAAKAWYEYAFNKLKVDTLYASAHIDNKGSRRILEKIGLQFKNEYIWDNRIPCVWYASK
ncbi:GNAT family N-acetyltransferase [Flavobacterium okayamense]|uniref:N-acetyltransferase n=1 Tax=Flavobacterium okayamense TaxID=2830782 RepID=A0ABM7S6H2_9FLAO|nr:GNAT family N-acetyltransferase [Flavobacterium okayamense]BCY29100.1 N-acetyltransferase [Flavobacterium okayamense]